MSLPAILMIHGMWSRPSTFTQLRAELEAVGIRSAAVTLPHHDVPPGAPAPAALGSLRLADYVAALQREAAALEGPISNLAAASILQTHKRTVLFIDPPAASLLSRKG